MKKIVMNEKINQRKSRLISLISLLFLLLLAKVVNAQDIIRLQLKDTVFAKVLDITPEFVKYKATSDSIEYIIKTKKVLEIQYENGTVVPISKNRWDNFYRPAIYAIVGQHEHDIKEENNTLQITSIGLGHKALFQLPVKGFGIVYSVDMNYGKYEYSKYYNNAYWSYKSGYLFSGNLSAGLEYRYSIFRGLGFYGDFQVGKSYMVFYKHDARFYSNDLIYSVSTGIYFNRFQLGLKYSWGQLMRSSEPESDDIIQTRTIKLSETQFFVAYVF